jgi:large subunit ribosomal protein L13
MRTTSITKPLEVERKWYVVDAADKNLGRLSSQVAHILRGKHKPMYTPNMDVGDHVIIINADKIKVTGRKMEQKVYRRHTGWFGGQRETPLKVMLQKKPGEVLKHSIKGMLPKNNLGRQMFRKLKVYAGPEHTHAAQQPEVLEIKY